MMIHLSHRQNYLGTKICQTAQVDDVQEELTEVGFDALFCGKHFFGKTVILECNVGKTVTLQKKTKNKQTIKATPFLFFLETGFLKVCRFKQ
jgi:predicted urease superfamily metal-dependent hydrolase